MDLGTVDRVKNLAKKMLDMRGISNDKSHEIEDDETVPTFTWGMRRGENYYVVYLQTLNKKSCSALLDMPYMSHCIVVYVTKTPVASKTLISTGRFELFSLVELLNNPLASSMVSTHELLPPDRAAEVLKAVPAHQRAVILTSDPVTRWLNAPIGSVIKSTECMGRLQSLEKYRVVGQGSHK